MSGSAGRVQETISLPNCRSLRLGFLTVGNRDRQTLVLSSPMCISRHVSHFLPVAKASRETAAIGHLTRTLNPNT